MKARILLFLILTGSLFYQQSFAQMSNSNEPARPSADTWNLTQHGKIQPTLYTGTLNLSVPFYHYQDSDFSIPISFDYATNGLLVNDIEGVLGLGWTLNAGGFVSREIKGLPDDLDATVLVLTNTPKTVKSFYKLHTSGLSESSMWYLYTGNRSFMNRPMFYTTSTVDDLYEAQPDIFHFNFMGYSGTFHLGFNRKIYVYDTNVSPDEIKIEVDFTDYSNQICFTDRNGVRYEFDGITGGSFDNTENTYINATTILTWKLSRIIAPNGRSVTFSYAPNRALKSFRPNTFRAVVTFDNGSYSDSEFYEPSSQIIQTDVSMTDLTSITISGGTSINFSYSNLPGRIAYTNTTRDDLLTTSFIGPPSLTGINVSYAGNNIKTGAFTYRTDNDGKRRLLQKIDISGEGSYSFEYNNATALPPYGSTKFDHWGYYNGTFPASTNLNVSTLAANGIDETITSTNAEANSTYSKYGTLSKITYPTGGTSHFSYAGHTYNHRITIHTSTGLSPYLTQQFGNAGGVRISEIEDRDSDGTLIFERTYSYDNVGTSSSGVLARFPHYQLRYTGGYGGATEMGTIWSNNLSRIGSTHIEYSRVTESYADGSSTVFHYTTNKNETDLLEFRNYAPEYSYAISGNYPSYTPWADTMEEISRLFMNTSMQAFRGKLIKTESKNASGTTLTTHETDYANIFPDREFNYVPSYLLHSTAEEAIYIGWIRGTNTSQSHHTTAGTQQSTSETQFNSNGLVAKEISTDSRGNSTISSYEYLSESSSGIEAQMFNKGLVAAPKTIRQSHKPDGAQEQTLSTTTYSYIQPAAALHPDLYRVGTVTETDNRTGESITSTYSYDNGGRLLQKTDGLGISTTYIWGYSGLYPVAVIENCTLSQVTSISGLSSLVSSPLSGSAVQYETALRAISGAEVTLYDYAPLVGLTKEITPDGKELSYSYNAAGKLHQVLDDLGRKLNTTLYSTENKSSSAL